MLVRVGSLHQLKIPKESNDSAKVLIEPNQKSNELSMNRKCGQRFITDGRRIFTKVLDADKDKVRRVNHTRKQ